VDAGAGFPFCGDPATDRGGTGVILKNTPLWTASFAGLFT
jgi:hypothetical protein